jgi:hypothetical protein
MRNTATLFALLPFVLMLASTSKAEGLIADGQVIVMIDASGKVYRHKLDVAAGTFGSIKRQQRAALFRVVKNTPQAFAWRGPRDTCTLTSNKRMTCPKLGNGTWSVQ